MAEQISVSRDTLRAELSDMELRIVDRLAKFQLDKASQRDLEAINKRVSSLERFRYAWPSAALLGAVTAVGTFILYVTHIHA